MDSLMTHFSGWVIGIIINRDQVIEGFDEFCFPPWRS
jgi:hypothetical protein